MLLLRGLPVVQHPVDVLARARCLAASALVAIESRDTHVLGLAEALCSGVEGALTPLESRALRG